MCSKPNITSMQAEWKDSVSPIAAAYSVGMYQCDDTSPEGKYLIRGKYNHFRAKHIFHTHTLTSEQSPYYITCHRSQAMNIISGLLNNLC